MAGAELDGADAGGAGAGTGAGTGASTEVDEASTAPTPRIPLAEPAAVRASASTPPGATAAGSAPAQRRARPPRLLHPLPRDGHWGWTGPIGVAVLAGLLRFWDLGRPSRLVFDETYYAKDAFSLLRYGHARAFVDGADEKLLAEDLDIFSGDPSFVVHPEVGKWMIAAGEAVFGVDPLGWRVAVALAGTLTVLIVARIGRRLFGSTLLGCTAGLLLALDGLHLVASRTAILDGLQAFWTVAAFGCLLADRDWARARFTSWARLRAARPGPPGRGPLLVWRPWRVAAGACLGLAVGTKWSAVWVLAVLGLLSVVWDAGARRSVGVSWARSRSLLLDAPVAFLSVVGTAFVTYVASWGGWIASTDGWSRQWGAEHPASGVEGLVPDWLRSLWHYHGEMYSFHTRLSDPHPYASDPWGWLLLSRPVSFDYVDHVRGKAGCEVDKCSQEVLAIGTPALWWGACAALLGCLWLWVGRRDWRAGALLLGAAATYLPWFLYLDRTVFSFYAVTTVPFLALAVALVLGAVVGPAYASPQRRAIGATVAGAYVLVVLANVAYLYPILVDRVIPYEAWQERMWFDSWI